MGKRIFLFIATNIAIVLTLSIVAAFLGVGSGIGPEGLNLQALAVFCLFWGMGGAFISLQMSRWIAKRATGVRLVDGRTGNSQADWLYETIARLTRQANLPMPEVGIYESPEVNAFATGPSKSRSLVAVSSGLLRSMRQDEVEGVLAHEIAHIANGDMVTMTLLQGVMNTFVVFLSRVIGYVVDRILLRNESDAPGVGYYLTTIVLDIALGFLAAIIVAWFSRRREFRADRGSAEYLGSSRPMANALARLGGVAPGALPQAIRTMGITDRPSWMALFSSHPPIEQRIAALRALGL
jgi:heat shock protein HtpX